MAIPIKPISGLRQAAKEMNRYSEARAMLADFVKAVEPVSAYNTMRAADASMEGETLSKFPSIVQACMKVHLTFVLELSMKPILLSTTMNMEALFNSEWFKDVAMKMKRVLDAADSDNANRASGDSCRRSRHSGNAGGAFCARLQSIEIRKGELQRTYSRLGSYAVFRRLVYGTDGIGRFRNCCVVAGLGRF